MLVPWGLQWWSWRNSVNHDSTRCSRDLGLYSWGCLNPAIGLPINRKPHSQETLRFWPFFDHFARRRIAIRVSFPSGVQASWARWVDPRNHSLTWRRKLLRIEMEINCWSFQQREISWSLTFNLWSWGMLQKMCGTPRSAAYPSPLVQDHPLDPTMRKSHRRWPHALVRRGKDSSCDRLRKLTQKGRDPFGVVLCMASCVNRWEVPAMDRYG